MRKSEKCKQFKKKGKRSERKSTETKMSIFSHTYLDRSKQRFPSGLRQNDSEQGGFLN